MTFEASKVTLWDRAMLLAWAEDEGLTLDGVFRIDFLKAKGLMPLAFIHTIEFKNGEKEIRVKVINVFSTPKREGSPDD